MTATQSTDHGKPVPSPQQVKRAGQTLSAWRDSIRRAERADWVRDHLAKWAASGNPAAQRVIGVAR